MDDKQIERLSNLTTYDELYELKMKFNSYGGFDIADVRSILDEHTKRVVAALTDGELTNKQLEALGDNSSVFTPGSS